MSHRTNASSGIRQRRAIALWPGKLPGLEFLGAEVWLASNWGGCDTRCASGSPLRQAGTEAAKLPLQTDCQPSQALAWLGYHRHLRRRGYAKNTRWRSTRVDLSLREIAPGRRRQWSGPLQQVERARQSWRSLPPKPLDRMPPSRPGFPARSGRTALLARPRCRYLSPGVSVNGSHLSLFGDTNECSVRKS